MLRPRAYTGPVKWLWCILVIATFRSAECLSDAELDATLHEQDHQPISDKFLSKLRQQRPPIWHSEDAGSGYSSLDTSREALELVSVERDSEFGPAGVTKWLSVQTRHTVYAVGIAERSITLVTAHPPKPAVPGTPKAYTYSTLTTDLPEVITAAATFEVHYPEDGTTQIYAVVASGSSLSTLSWFRISDDELLQEKAWTRKLEVSVSEMAVAALSPDDFILILNTCTVTSESACRPSIDIYQFHSSDITNIKLSQSISLSAPAGPVSVGTIRDVVLLAIPVPAVGKVLLYRHVAPTKLYDNAMYEPVEGVYDNLYGYFKPHLSPINSSEVAQAVFFQQHHKTFLAVSGLSRAVYLVDDDLELTGCPIPMSKFGRVVRWVVVPIPNYRQDVVLLAQYQVETMARGAPLLQFGVAAFTYANNALQYQRDTYCYVSRSEPPLQGSADCLLLFGNPTGIDGTAVLPLKGSSAVFVLVPNGVTPSSLVGVYTKLVEAADPVIYELDALNNLRNQIEIVIAHQESAIHELELTLQDSLRTEGLNIITGAWNVEDISSSLVEVDDEGSIKESKMIGKTYSENLGKADLEVKLEDVTHDYVQLEAVVKEINKDLRNVLLRSEDGVVELEDTLTVLGGLEVASESNFEFLTTTSLNGEPVQALFEDAVRLDNLREITSHKILPELDADNVVFSSINNIPASRLIFDSVSSEPINIDGSIHFNNGLKTDAVSLTGGGKVNGIDIAQEVFVPTKPIPVPVSFDKVSVADVQSDLVNNIVLNADTFYKYIHWGLDHQSLNGTVLNSAKVEGNVMVEYVNGVYWAELVNGLVWTDQPAKILGPTSISQVVFKDGVDITTLNQLAFPGDFVVRSDPEHITTGQKTFKGGLYAAEVDATSINDVKLDSIVTLNSDQTLRGALTLSQAFVGTNLKVDSKLNGVSIASINTPSPTLREGGNISANVYFDTLQVDGPVVVSQSMGNSLFTDILSDVVVVPPAGSTEPIVISGDKTLPSLAASSLTINSGLINGLPVDGFVTTNTEQVFKNPIVSTAHIEFGNVDVNGLWDGVDVVKLKNNVMTVSGNQKTSTRLTYASPFELWASQLTIDELNEYLTDETVSVVYPGLPDHEHDVQLSENGEVVVDGSLGAGDIQVGGNVIVKGTACDVNLLEFEQNRLSLSKPQTVYSDIKVDNLEVIQLLNVSLINNMPLPTLSSTYPTAPADLEAGGYFVDELVVKGDIKTVLGMNGIRIDQVAKDAIWLDGNADPLEGNFVFTEPLYVGSVVVHNGVNGQDLDLVEANAVFKGQDVVLKGATSIESLAIQGNLVTPNLLGLNPADILMRDREQIVQGLRVSGDVFVAGEVAIDRSINGENIKKIAGRYKKLGKGRHQIIGNLSMSGDVSADDVYVHGNVNNQNLQDFLSSTVDKYSDNGIPITGNIVLSNSAIFVEPVTVEESGTVNGVDLSEYYQNLVLTNGSYTEIISKVVFESTVSAGDAFTVNGVVEAGTLYGCNVTGWYSDAILINEDTVLQGNRSFDDVTTKFLNTSTLNSVDMSKVIYLNEDQRIDASLNFAEITSNRLIEVGGMINGVDLKAAFRNTLLTQNDEFPIQEIVGKTFTGPVIVKGNLDVLGGINDLDVTKVVTLEGDQTITSPLLFQGPLTAKSSISATTLSSKPIANINLVDWSERILLSDSAEVQTVNQPWNITGNVTFAEAVSGTGALNGIDVRSLEAMKQDVQDQIGAIRAKLTDKYKKMCFEVQALSAAAQKQPFIFRQIDAVQSLVSPPINSIHIFKVAKKTFLFVSHLYSCQGALYEWNAEDTQWYLVVHDVANAGGISEWLTVPATKNGPTYLVTSAEFNGLDCNNYGGRVWKFDRAAGLEHAGEIIPWTHGKVDTKKREFFVMSKSKMATYGMDSGAPLEKHLRDLPSGTTSSMVTARSAAGDLIMKNGAVSDTAALLHLDKFVSSLLSVIKHRDHFALFEMPDGKRLAAVFEESSRSVTIHNVDWQLVVGRISTNNARWITPLELGDALHPGQTHIAFIEEHNVLRVLQYKGEQGFVDVARIELPIDVFGMKSVWLPARGLLRDRLYLVIRGQTKVLMLEVEMLGDPLPEAPPTCDRDIGF